MVMSRLYPRTNALGSAKTDCHTCARLREFCDRQRPRCGSCRERGRKCGGFVLDIVWNNEKQPRQRSSTPERDGLAPENEGVQLGPFSQPLRFVQNGSKRRRKKSKLPSAMDQFMTTMPATSQIPDQKLPSLGLGPETPSSTEEFGNLLGTDVNSIWSDPGFSGSASHTCTSSPPQSHDCPLGVFSTSELPTWNMAGPQWQDHSFELALQLYGQAPMQGGQPLLPNPYPLSPGPLHSNPTDKAAAILDMCESRRPTIDLCRFLMSLTFWFQMTKSSASSH